MYGLFMTATSLESLPNLLIYVDLHRAIVSSFVRSGLP